MMTRNRHTEDVGPDCTRRVSHQSGTANPPRLIMVVFPGRPFQTARKYLLPGGFCLGVLGVVESMQERDDANKRTSADGRKYFARRCT